MFQLLSRFSHSLVHLCIAAPVITPSALSSSAIPMKTLESLALDGICVNQGTDQWWEPFARVLRFLRCPKLHTPVVDLQKVPYILLVGAEMSESCLIAALKCVPSLRILTIESAETGTKQLTPDPAPIPILHLAALFQGLTEALLPNL